MSTENPAGHETTGTDTTTHRDLTNFQTTILATIAGETPYGLAIKRDLDDYYGEEVNRGRLYPNLNKLVERGLVAKSARDKRTNEYELTPSGQAVLSDRIEWLTGQAIHPPAEATVAPDGGQGDE